MRGVRYRRVRGPSRPTPPAARAPAGAPAAVLWSGPWAGIGALPRVSRETVAALRGLGIPVQAAGESRERRGPYARRRSLRHVAVHVQWLPAGFWRAFQPSTRKVAYTFCESTSLPVAPRRLLLPDLIVVPSTFCADVFRTALDGGIEWEARLLFYKFIALNGRFTLSPVMDSVGGSDGQVLPEIAGFISQTGVLLDLGLGWSEQRIALEGMDVRQIAQGACRRRTFRGIFPTPQSLVRAPGPIQPAALQHCQVWVRVRDQNIFSLPGITLQGGGGAVLFNRTVAFQRNMVRRVVPGNRELLAQVLGRYAGQ